MASNLESVKLFGLIETTFILLLNVCTSLPTHTHTTYIERHQWIGDNGSNQTDETVFNSGFFQQAN